MIGFKEFLNGSSIKAFSRPAVCRARLLGPSGKLFLLGALSLTLFGCAQPRASWKEPYRERYDKSLVSSGALFASLPPAVQNTVRAETGSASVADVAKYKSGGRVVYKIFFQNHDLFPPLYVASDGTLLDPNLTVAIGAPQDTSSIATGGPVSGITLNDLPPAVVKALQRRVPDAVVDSIVKQVNHDQTTYVVTFKDRLHPTIEFAADGSVVEQ
jgi:hypothetical protein